MVDQISKHDHSTDNDGGDDISPKSVNTEQILSKIQISSADASSGSGTSSDQYDIGSMTLKRYLYELDRGYYLTDGLETDPTLDYEEFTTYIQGNGIRTTTLEHRDGSSPTIRFDSSDTGVKDGNFGGISDMTIYGAGKGVGSANIVESVMIIDLIIKNVIIRYGGNRGLRLGGCSGARVQNVWIEGCSVGGLWLNQGTRLKVTNSHIVGNDGNQIRIHSSRSNFNSLTLSGGTRGIYLSTDSAGNGGDNNIINNVIFGGHSEAAITVNQATEKPNTFSEISHHSDNTSFEGIEGVTGKITYKLSHWAGFDRQAIRLRSSSNKVEGGTVTDWGISSSSYGALVISGGNNNIIKDVTFRESRENGRNELIRIDGGNNNIINAEVYGDESWNVGLLNNASDNIINIPQLNWSNLTLTNETRTVLNGVGRNSGDPSSTGDWNGHGYEGVRVIDTSASPNVLYEYANGSWIEIGTA